MTHRERRQLAVLAVLLVAMAAVYAYRWRGSGPAETAERPSNSQGNDGGAGAGVPVVDLRLDRLQAESGELPDAQRDPFRFRPLPPPAPPPRPVVTPPPGPEELVPGPPPGPPPPPPITVKFFGLVVLRGERVATFSDTRGNTFYGKEGDIIEGRYRILRVGTDSVDLAYLDGRGRQTIRLTGQ